MPAAPTPLQTAQTIRLLHKTPEGEPDLAILSRALADRFGNVVLDAQKLSNGDAEHLASLQSLLGVTLAAKAAANAATAVPAILSTAEIWLEGDRFLLGPGEKIGSWLNRGTLLAAFTQATAANQGVVSHDARGFFRYAGFAGVGALSATVNHTGPRTVFCLLRAGLPTTNLQVPFASGGGKYFINQQSNVAAGAWYATVENSGYIFLPATARAANSWVLAEIVFNGASSSFTLSGDPLVSATGDTGPIPAAQTVAILGGLAANSSNPFTGQIGAYVTFGSALSATNKAAVRAYLLAKAGGTTQIVFDGTSITAGNNAGVNNDYPTKILPHLTFPGCTVSNLGVPGQTIVQMASDAATQIDANISTVAARKILVAEAPTNDLFGGATVAVAFANYVAYCQARKAVGFTVIATTIMPRTDSGTPGGFEAARLAFNSLVVGSYLSFSSALVNPAADSRLADSTHTTYFLDLVHPTATGNEVYARLLATVLNALP